jgi:hypothetical protein
VLGNSTFPFGDPQLAEDKKTVPQIMVQILQEGAGIGGAGNSLQIHKQAAGSFAFVEHFQLYQ